MINNYDWIKDLKVGDEVAIDMSRYGNHVYRIAKVEGITAAGNIKALGCIFNGKDGWQRGGDQFHSYVLKQLTPELKAKIADKAERRALLEKIESFKMDRQDTAKLRAIAAILESEEAE